MLPMKSGVILAAVLVVVVGCSKTNPQPPATTPPPAEQPLAEQPPAAAATPAATPAGTTPVPNAQTPEAAAPAEAGRPAPSRRAPAAAPSPSFDVTLPPPASARAPEPAAAVEPPKPKVAYLRAGQVITIRTTRQLSSKTAKTGELFSAILEEPIESGGWVVAGGGARIDGRIVEADKGGRIKGRASLSIELTSLTTTDGRKVDIVTSPVSQEAGKNQGKDAAKVGVGAGAGAVVGGIAGGGKGAAVGALLGGGAGAAMRGEAAEIPAETVLNFELRSPVTIHEKK